MKNPRFVNGEFYHVYNRGTDKRRIFSNQDDLERFFMSMDEFNAVEPSGSLYELSFLDPSVKLKKKRKRLVRFVAYCLNPNHYHFILRQVANGGISEFMKRLGGGYTWYFNHNQKRSGYLFQGAFKAKHIDSNEYLLHLSAYVNLNHQVHQLGGQFGGMQPPAKLIKSSWDEYVNNNSEGFCEKKIILEQFKNTNEYKKFAESSLIDIVERKQQDKELAGLLLE